MLNHILKTLYCRLVLLYLYHNIVIIIMLIVVVVIIIIIIITITKTILTDGSFPCLSNTGGRSGSSGFSNQG